MSDYLRDKYKKLLAGFEGFNFTDEQLQLARFSLENARLDMESCMACTGDICKTMVNRRSKTDWKTKEFLGWDYSVQDGGKFYYALSPEGCAVSKNPNFALFACPGVIERKKAITGILRRVGNREELKQKAIMYE